MAGNVEIDPEGFRKGTRALGNGSDSARAWGTGLAATLSGLGAALGSDQYGEKTEDLRRFADNICIAGGEEMPGAADAMHDAMCTAVESFEAAEGSSSQSFS